MTYALLIASNPFFKPLGFDAALLPFGQAASV